METSCCAKTGDIFELHVSEHSPHLTAQAAVHEISMSCINDMKSVGIQNMGAV